MLNLLSAGILLKKGTQLGLKTPPSALHGLLVYYQANAKPIPVGMTFPWAVVGVGAETAKILNRCGSISCRLCIHNSNSVVPVPSKAAPTTSENQWALCPMRPKPSSRASE